MPHRILWVVALSLAALLAFACSSANPGSQPTGGSRSASASPTPVPERYALQQALNFTMTLTTTSVRGTFGRLDRKHTCERSDTSPHLAWDGVPDGTESLAIVVEDPESDVYGLVVDVLWTHWVVYSIPPDVTEIEPGQVVGESLENGGKQGTNDYERVQYNGPCPLRTLTFPTNYTSGAARQSRPHIIAEDRPYVFRVYALDDLVDIPPGADRDTLLEAIDGHILAVGELPINYKSVNTYPCRTTDVTICLSTPGALPHDPSG